MNDDVIRIDLGAPEGAAHGDEVPELREGPDLDLPAGAVPNPDGSVTLTFEEPARIAFRPVGGGEPREETFDHFDLKRLKGAQLRRVLDAAPARKANLLLSLSSGISEAKLALLYPRMEAPDLMAARMVLNVLIEGEADGVPAHAEKLDDGSVRLPLRWAAADGEGEPRSELLFRKLKADALIAMQGAKDPLSVSLHKATGLSLKAATGLIDDMDAADVFAAQRVVLFLSGIGRRSGG